MPQPTPQDEPQQQYTPQTAELFSHPARDEATRQLVILAAGLVFVGLAAWLERLMSSPDAARTVKMHATHQAEVALASLAAWSWRWAERARVAYQAQRG